MTTPHRSAPTRALPHQPNLNQLKRQAKELLKAFQAGDRPAADEVNTHYRDADRATFALHDAQLVIARAYGFESWPKLAQHVRPDDARDGLSKPSRRMSQPGDMRGRQWRRNGVAVDGDQAWAMFCACADGDLDTVRRLYHANPDFVHAQIHYCKPIEFALRENHDDVVRFLLEQEPVLLAKDVYGGARIAQCSGGAYRIRQQEMLRRGYSELDQIVIGNLRRLAPHASEHYRRLDKALQDQDLERISQLLDQYPDLVNATDMHGNGPVHHAVRYGRQEAVELLLDRGASIDLERHDGLTPITLSAWHSPALTGYLLARGAQCTISAAAAMGRLENVKQLIGANPQTAHQLDANGYVPITYAAREGHADIVQLLLDHGVDPNRPEQDAWYGAALFYACLNDHRDVIRLLLDRGANANAGMDSSGWCLDRYSGWEGIRQLLREHGAIVQPMHMNVQRMKDAILCGEQIIYDDDGAAMQFAGGWGSFVCTVVRYRQDIELLDLYVEKVGTERLKQLSSIDYYTTNGAFIDRLVVHGADLNRRDWLGRNVLFQCACWACDSYPWSSYLPQRPSASEVEKNIAATKAYLKHGVDPNVIEVSDSTTPLGYAARCGHIEMVNLLLDDGADPNLPEDRPWCRPLAYAESEGHAAVAALLKSRAARA